MKLFCHGMQLYRRLSSTSFKAGNLILAIGNSVKSLVERAERLSHIHVGAFVEMIGDQCYDLCKEHESTVMNQYHR